MISNLKPYPRMNDYGVKWLGKIPAHWEMHKLKTTTNNVIELTKERDVSELYIALEHVQGWTGNIKDAGLDISFDSQVKKFRNDDVLLGKLRPYLAKVARPNRNGVCVGEFLVLRPKNNRNNAAYLEFFLRSKPVIDIINSSTFGAKMPRANWLFIGNLDQPLPSVSEQVAIVRYLNHVNRRVRKMIRGKRKLITLLTEQKQTIIHYAVTHGLDPDVPLKNSGIKWLGKVPIHWKVLKIKQCADMFFAGGTPSSDTENYYSPARYGIPWVTISDMTAQPSIRNTIKSISEEGRISKNLEILPVGTLLYSMYASLGTASLLETPACINQAIIGILFDSSHMERKFAFYFLRSIQSRIVQLANTSTQPNLNAEKVRTLSIVQPSLSEQTEIVKYLDQVTADIDATITRANREIELLEEYRTRLISDVVTGKLDVREAAAALPEVDPLAEDDEPDDDLDPDTTPDEEPDTLEEEEA